MTENRKTEAEKSVLTGITLGDPAGVGPEILLKALLSEERRKKPHVVFGSPFVLKKAMADLNLDLGGRLRTVGEAGEFSRAPGIVNLVPCGLIPEAELRIGKVSASAGRAAYDAVETAIRWALKGQVDAVATCPLNKEALRAAGIPFPGHTEIFTRLTGARRTAMLLHADKLSVIHTSTHLSLAEAVAGLESERILETIELAHETLKALLGRPPRVAVAGVNPHTGENGLFGREEIETIAPAVEAARRKGILAEGPLPPDTVFFRAVEGEWDVVVAMYHDQGHIPMKLLDFHGGVNITAGLPIIRTSVDHGTAFDIAWRNRANPRSLLQALAVAETLAHAKRDQ